MEKLSEETVYQGRVRVNLEEWLYPDGYKATREIISKDNAVAIVAHDNEHFYMIRQPREAVNDARLLELPAGTLDVDGEPELACAQRELVEEIGMEATDWTQMARVYTSPGFTTEKVVIFKASGLTYVGPQPTEGERIEILKIPLNELDQTIDIVEDAKSLIGLLQLQASLAS